MKRVRLRDKFMVVFMIVAFVPLFALGGLSLFLIDLSHRQDVSHLQLQTIDQKIEEIRKFFADTLGVLELQVGFSQRSEIALQDQQFILRGILSENRAFEEVRFISRSGIETAKESRFLEHPELFTVSELPEFKASSAGKEYIGPVEQTLAGPVVSLSSPVRNRTGDIIQILAARVNISQLVRSIESSRIGASGYLLLFDRDGAFIGTAPHGAVSPGSSLADYSRVKRVGAGEVLDALDPRDRYASKFSTTPVAGAGKKVPQTQWVMLAEWPLADADALIRDVRTGVFEFTLFTILAVFFLAPFFAGRLTKSIRELEEGAAEIEKGNFAKQVSIKSRDELEDLGESFNRMARGLKQLQELKNEFAFIAAHELRTPVTAIKGFLSMVFEGDAGTMTEKMKTYLDPVRQANDRLIQLVNDILEIARSEAGRMKIEVRKTDMKKSISDIVAEVAPIASAKHISISYNSGDTVPAVLADELRLKEVIMNFVSNAIKYNNDNGWVKISHETRDRMLVTLIEDSGLGMSAEDQTHLFEKFFRSDAAKVKTIQGTGLGLFITKELVEKMGGAVGFKSEEGRGTTFYFSLPIA